MKAETKFRIKIDPLLDGLKNSWWESIQQKSIRGTPDKIGCINGRFVALEFKRDDYSPISRLQEYKLDKITAAGGVAFRVSPENWPRIYEHLQEIADDTTRLH